MWPRTSALACVARCSRNTSPNTNIGGRWAPPQKRRRSRRSSVPSLLRAANSDGRIDEGVGVDKIQTAESRGVCPVYDASTIVSLILINPGLSSRTVQVHRHHHVRGDLLSLLLRRRRGRRRGGDWPLYGCLHRRLLRVCIRVCIRVHHHLPGRVELVPVSRGILPAMRRVRGGCSGHTL